MRALDEEIMFPTVKQSAHCNFWRLCFQSPTSEQVLDLQSQIPVLNLCPIPTWIYDPVSCRNIWGNKSAMGFFALSVEQFKAVQIPQENNTTWKKENARLHGTVMLQKEKINMNLAPEDLAPGFPTLPNPLVSMKVSYGPVVVTRGGQQISAVLVQVEEKSSAAESESHQAARLHTMCADHRMFQFLFNEDGLLLAANKSAMDNMKQRLGSPPFYFMDYLGIGECDGHVEDLYREAMDAIFVEKQDGYRMPQRRWSKRYPGKSRWVLYDLWPVTDPVTGKAAVLVTEQNITQVKEIEEEFKKRTKQLESQLVEVLTKARDNLHDKGIDIDTPAEKTLKLLEKIIRGSDVSMNEAMELRDAIAKSTDMSNPAYLNEQLLKNPKSAYEVDVGESLLQLLSTRRPNEKEEAFSEQGSGRLSVIPESTNGQATLLLYPQGPPNSDTLLEFVSMVREPTDELASVLSHADEWQFDAFALERASNGRPLSVVGFYLLKHSGLVEKFQIDEARLARYLIRIEDGYPDNPYHNRVHASDVLRSMHVLMIRGGLNKYVLDDFSALSCYLSALVHDFEHKGVNNDFLIRASDPLAILYNDRSPMENHHLAAAWSLLNSDDYNFLGRVPKKNKEIMRKQMIDMVLATDMKQHFAIHSMFQTKMQVSSNKSSHSGSTRASRSTNGAHGLIRDTSRELEMTKLDEDSKSLALQVALKCADLGHLASPRPTHRKWVAFLEEEFFRQGDREKSHSLNVSPLMDRAAKGISKSQIGFFDIVAMPLFQSFSQVFCDATPLLDALRDNYMMWKEESSSSTNGSAA